MLATQFINPNAPLIPIAQLQRLNATFNTLQTLHDDLGKPNSIAAQFMLDLPAGLDATPYGGSTPTDQQAVVNWVTSTTVYPKVMDLIVIDNPTGDLGDCSGTNLSLRYSNPDTTKNLLSGTDYLKIIRFVRLWSTLTPLLGDGDDAVTIESTDDIISALYPQSQLPAGTSDATNQTLLDGGFTTLLQRAGVVFEAMNLLSLTADQGLAQLLACFAPIQTYGANALYRRMFLTPTVLQQDPGAQTATVSPAFGIGDDFQTLINNALAAAYTVGPAKHPRPLRKVSPTNQQHHNSRPGLG